ncbi:MAG: 4-(cytidine 5'-diphospho)-2-C-methyl-D-erythritol kinase [Gemmatimonadetes bacterium]|nr:4-(cytidine 5'-diphospho)-2-C-methyl-D-erythritol kinase [Gemmatimonadota bacterium]
MTTSASPAAGRDVDPVRERAHAKVNLRLEVLAREESGYHQIETVFCALELADELQARRGPHGIELHLEGADLGPVRDNLVYRAAEAFFREAALAPDVDIRLRKRIPVAAGLGGGSSDAAATLRALNRLHGEPLEPPSLLRLGAGLGADVCFFLCGSPLALAWGRGERLLPLPPLPAAPVILAVPRFRSDTAEAYRALDAARGHRPATLPAARVLHPREFADWHAVAPLAHNDFEDVIFDRFPELRAIRDALRESRPSLALLAGSGSAVFAIYADAEQRARAAGALRARFSQLALIETATATGA